MSKTSLFISLLLSLNQFPKTAEEYYKKAEAYSEKSKQGFIFAAIALVFVIEVK